METSTTLVGVEMLMDHLADRHWAVVDCRFALADPAQGERDYLAGHVAGAVYAHLDRDLSSPVIPGRTGRHPLPDPTLLAERLGGWGVGPGTQVVAYDAMGGALAASRLWWLLKWLGHDAAAVLDGGWQAWQAAGGPITIGGESRTPQTFVAQLRPELIADTAAVEVARLDTAQRVLDARGADRFRGENETIDPVAGRIPGACSLPFAGNLDATGHFLPPQVLRERYAAVLGDLPTEAAVAYCGSGVTAAHDVLAMAHAGMGMARLYAGSWSEWITEPGRAVAVGA